MRLLADLMGGTAGVDNTPGCGSTFWFTANFGGGTVPGHAQHAAGRHDRPAHAAGR